LKPIKVLGRKIDARAGGIEVFIIGFPLITIKQRPHQSTPTVSDYFSHVLHPSYDLYLNGKVDVRLFLLKLCTRILRQESRILGGQNEGDPKE